MSFRSLLLSVFLIIPFFAKSGWAQTSGYIELRYDDGVELVQEQREGLDEIVRLAQSMRRLTEQAALFSTTQVERKALDTRFQQLKGQIEQIASATEAHGYYVLNAVVYFCVQISPGSDRCAVFLGMDARPSSLSLTEDNLLSWANASSAITTMNIALDMLYAGLQRNCASLHELGVNTSCGFTEQVCETTVNSTGLGALLGGFGTLEFGHDDFFVLATDWCPSNNLGWFIMGQHPTNIPFGNGRLCIDRGAGPLYRISSAQLIPSFNRVYFPLADAGPLFDSLVQPGATWYFQFIFNDNQANGMNSTNALRVTFEL